MVCALYAIRERATRETEDRIKGDLLTDLLADRFRDESEARERARHLGLDFSGAPLRVLVLGHEPLDAYLERRRLDARSAGAAARQAPLPRQELRYRRYSARNSRTESRFIPASFCPLKQATTPAHPPNASCDLSGTTSPDCAPASP